VGAALSSLVGGGYVNYFSFHDRAYKVIPQVQQADRLNADQLNNTYYPHRERQLDPALDPRSHHDEHRSAGAQSLPAAERGDHRRRAVPGLTQGEAIAYCRTSGREPCRKATPWTTPARRGSSSRNRPG